MSSTQSLASRIQAANDVLLVPGNLDRASEFFAPDYVAHVTGQDMQGGPAFVAKFLGMLQRAFPDLQAEVEILVEGTDRVAWQRTVTGTQAGAFKGFPASGKRLVWRDVVTSRFKDGLIVEDWSITDLAESLLLARKKR